MFRIQYITMYTVCYCFILLLCSCSTKNTKIPQEYIRVGVAPYAQPTTIGEIFSGSINPYRIKATEEEISTLNILLTELITMHTTLEVVPTPMTKAEEGLPTPLERWVAVGVANNIDILIIPQIFQWKEAGYIRDKYIPPYVIIDYYLLDVKTKTLVARSHYYEDFPITLNDLRYNKTPNGMFYRKYVDRISLAKDSILMMLSEFQFIQDVQDKNILYQ